MAIERFVRDGVLERKELGNSGADMVGATPIEDLVLLGAPADTVMQQIRALNNNFTGHGHAYGDLVDRPFVSVKDYGAVGDGVTDDRAAIQAALDANLNVHFPAGRYIVNGSLSIRRFQTWTGTSGLYGQGLDDADEGNAKLIFTGTATACIVAADPTANLIHCGIAGMTIRAKGTYDWMMDLPTCVSFKMRDIRMETTVLTTGGIRSKKLVAGSFSWVNTMHNVQIKLPEDPNATGTCLDIDWSDAEIMGGGCFGGKYNVILRGTGGIKLMGGRYSQSNASGAGIVINVETESRSQHQVVGCQVEEHKNIGLLVYGDTVADPAETWVMFNVIGANSATPRRALPISSSPMAQGRFCAEG